MTLGGFGKFAAWFGFLALTGLACEHDENRRLPDAGGVIDGGLDFDSAAAAPPVINIGSGYAATVTVDPVGTGYVAWVGPESNVTSLNFCRLPRGAATCAVNTTIETLGTSLSRPFVIVANNVVHVLSYRYGLTDGRFDAVFLYTSNDGGVTFGPGQQVGTTPFSAAVLGADGTVSLVTHAHTPGLAYQRVSLAAPQALMTQAMLSTTHPYSGAVALLEQTRPVVVYANATGQAQMRRHLMGDPNDEATWSAPLDIGYGDRMHLASGVSGLFLMGQAADTTLQVRRWNGETFAPGVALPSGNGELAQAHLVQDAMGRLHAVWPRIDVDGISLHHATSSDGAAWSHRVAAKDEGFVAVRAAVAADHKGFATWATTASSSSARVRVVALGELP